MFKKAMLDDSTLNENGAIAYTSSGDPRVDYFSMIVRGASKDTIVSLLKRCWAINKLDTVKLIFQKRDCRGGVGEKDLFYHSMIWLWTFHSQVFLKNVQFVPEYGSFKDWCKLVEHDHSLRYVIGKEFAKQLQVDAKCVDNIGTVSLCAKYAPSEKHEYDKKIPGFVNIIAKYYSDDFAYKKTYRKILGRLRSNIDIVETQMCKQDWDNINYNAVPSRATHLYRTAFEKHNPVGYQEWLNDVLDGRAKINVGQLQPHELSAKYIDGCAEIDEFTEAQWNQMIDEMVQNNEFKSCVAMPDMSGSMSGLPMNVAATLGILVAKVAHKQNSQFGNMVISFSEKPSFIDLDKCNTLHECVNVLMRGESNGFNTDLHRAFALMIDKALLNNVPSAAFPEKIIIFTDMQFDEAIDCCGNSSTLIDLLDELFDSSPYKRPDIVCWNLRNTGNVSCTSETNGVALVSGFSKDTFNNIINNSVMTPYDVMRQSIDDERYARLQV